MAVRREGRGWTAEFHEDGRTGRRICQRGFPTREAARRYEADFIALRQFTGRPLDERLSHLVLIWYEQHGRSLKAHRRVLLLILAVVERLGDPVLAEFDAQAWERYRAERITVVSARRMLCERARLARMFTDLLSSGTWVGINPFAAGDVPRGKGGGLGTRIHRRFSEMGGVDLELDNLRTGLHRLRRQLKG
ncbi:hypothetical protein [Metapseudomonas resinovorans]|uniref:Phage integrase N-terminal domain-containing protein n=1 Tax=Metapseudomonas resinovorans NBRC 106553 TaxID=1245471 RepID=S6BNH0_METRE|nr:hypothetical protein [Pseudomonas resinovorans]BAN50569.1 hypothetical protein PCA10_48370 [Pseudomonas resinovorans NBRC 106553]